MEKIIKLGNKEVKLSNNVAWTMEYYDQYHTDIVPALIPLFMSFSEGVAKIIAETGKTENIGLVDIASALEGQSLDVLLPLGQLEMNKLLVGVLWAMAKAADESIDPPKQWIRQFDVFPLDVIIPTLYNMALSGFVSSKNLKRLKNLGKSLRDLQPSLSTTSSSPDSNGD